MKSTKPITRGREEEIPPKFTDRENNEVPVDKEDDLFKVMAGNGLIVRISNGRILTSARGNKTEIPVSRVTGITLQKSALDRLRFEATIVMHLECGRIVTIRRLPSPKATEMKRIIRAAN